ncbi:MAG: hypothetical protein GXP59_05730 [Deltaproteobacteria bacterium]|nr:hypothetical protein [Deltaproteobacteria bacterium]
MNDRTKGVLLSGLVFPGLGQFVQGRTKAGIWFISVSILGLMSITYSAVHKVMIIMDQIRPQLANGIHINFHDIINIATQIPNNLIDNIGPIIFIGCWLASTIHTFFYKDKSSNSDSK